MSSTSDTNEKQAAIARKLQDLRRQEEENRAKELAKKLSLRYINLILIPIEIEALGLISEEKAKEGKLAVIKKDDKELHLAIYDPTNSETQTIINGLTTQGFQIKIFTVSLYSLKRAWEYYKELTPAGKEITGRIEISVDFLKKTQKEISAVKDISTKISQIPPTEASKIAEVIIAGALNTDSSDIHIEPKEKDVLLRYRIDGLLRDIVSIPKKSYQLILSRIKLLSGLTLNVHDIAQDGRFTIRLEDIDIENRVSILPGPNGENIVIRILNPKSLRPGLKDLGLRTDLYEIVEKQITKPNGMIVTTGPTGSGKTTALYAFLKSKVSPEIKIITLEDPIEYHLPEIVQTQVETEQGYTFASGLRAILRQDPDVILVGEIRDKETAETAVQAALTGHLVFSTLHTNDAAGAVPRFVELGVKPAILSSALTLTMAQRLLRRLCLKCKESYKPDRETVETIKNNFKNIDQKLIPIDLNKPFNLYQSKGCPDCDETGYKGRIGIFEMIVITPEMEKIIAKGPSHADITDIIYQKGITTMYQDGLFKVLEGITTLEELETVTVPPSQ